MASTNFSVTIDDENELIEEIQQESLGNEPTDIEAVSSSKPCKTTSIVWNTIFIRQCSGSSLPLDKGILLL